MKKLSILTLGVFLGALVAFAAPAFADREDIAALAAAKISLSDAIAAAEKDTGGKAFEASIDGDTPSPYYEVSVVKDGKVWEVAVSPADASIVSKREDHDD